jgi:hypothetical protein
MTVPVIIKTKAADNLRRRGISAPKLRTIIVGGGISGGLLVYQQMSSGAVLASFSQAALKLLNLPVATYKALMSVVLELDPLMLALGGVVCIVAVARSLFTAKKIRDGRITEPPRLGPPTIEHQ